MRRQHFQEEEAAPSQHLTDAESRLRPKLMQRGTSLLRHLQPNAEKWAHHRCFQLCAHFTLLTLRDCSTGRVSALQGQLQLIAAG